MTVRFGGPYPLIETLISLPDPQFGDSEGYLASIDSKRSMDNTQYTYVKSKDGRKRLQLRFNLTRMKMLELRAFLNAYYRTRVTYKDHLGDEWIGWITTNPNEFETIGAYRNVGMDVVGGTYGTIQIEFEGTKQ